MFVKDSIISFVFVLIFNCVTKIFTYIGEICTENDPKKRSF